MFFSCVCGVLCIYNDCFKLAKLKARFRTFQIASLIKGDGKPVLQQAARAGLEPETLERPELKASRRPKGAIIRGIFFSATCNATPLRTADEIARVTPSLRNASRKEKFLCELQESRL